MTNCNHTVGTLVYRPPIVSEFPFGICLPGYSESRWRWGNPYINRCTTLKDYDGLNIEVGMSLRNLANDALTRGCRNIPNIHVRHFEGMCSSSLPMCCHNTSRKFNIVMLMIYETVTTNHF